MRIVLLLAACALASCASLDPAECRGANWYDLGFRDAIFGLQPQDVVYEPQCGRHGVKLDTASYAKGWREGKWELDHRRNESHD